MSRNSNSGFSWSAYWLTGGFIVAFWVTAMKGGGTALDQFGNVVNVGANPWTYALFFLGWLVLGLGRSCWETRREHRDGSEAEEQSNDGSQADTEA